MEDLEKQKQSVKSKADEEAGVASRELRVCMRGVGVSVRVKGVKGRRWTRVARLSGRGVWGSKGSPKKARPGIEVRGLSGVSPSFLFFLQTSFVRLLSSDFFRQTSFVRLQASPGAGRQPWGSINKKEKESLWREKERRPGEDEVKMAILFGRRKADGGWRIAEEV